MGGPEIMERRRGGGTDLVSILVVHLVTHPLHTARAWRKWGVFTSNHDYCSKLFSSQSTKYLFAYSWSKNASISPSISRHISSLQLGYLLNGYYTCKWVRQEGLV